MTSNRSKEWEDWKHNFCQHISDWSYFSADEELEKMKQSLLSQQRAELIERTVKECWYKILELPNNADDGILMECELDDIYTSFKDVINLLKGEV
jgi:hypothetical protein